MEWMKTKAQVDAEAKAAKQEAEQSEARAYLASTDWLIVRHAETGQAVPLSVTEKRQTARDVLSS